MHAAAIVLGGVIALGCSPGGSDLSNCRSFPVQWDGQVPGFTPLVIDEGSGAVTYTQPGVGGVSTYDSVEDFVIEGQTFGRVTRTSWTAPNLETRQFSYNSDGTQADHSRESATPGPIGYETATWTEYDAQSRPISGTHESSWAEAATPSDRLDVCSGSAVTIAYDQDARTATMVVDYSGTVAGGGVCVDTPFINIAGRVEVEFFDGGGNLSRTEIWQGFREPTGDAQLTLSPGRVTASDTVCND